jgi:hypothetical protein
METFNETIPHNVDMIWVTGDTFTFLDSTITVWLSKACGEGLNVEDYDGALYVKYRKQDSTLQTITTDSGEMIFTDNVITFNKPDLSLKVGDYFYQLKLINKIDSTDVGTLLEGKFKVQN